MNCAIGGAATENEKITILFVLSTIPKIRFRFRTQYDSRKSAKRLSYSVRFKKIVKNELCIQYDL